MGGLRKAECKGNVMESKDSEAEQRIGWLLCGAKNVVFGECRAGGGGVRSGLLLNTKLIIIILAKDPTTLCEAQLVL